MISPPSAVSHFGRQKGAGTECDMWREWWDAGGFRSWEAFIFNPTPNGNLPSLHSPPVLSRSWFLSFLFLESRVVVPRRFARIIFFFFFI